MRQRDRDDQQRQPGRPAAQHVRRPVRTVVHAVPSDEEHAQHDHGHDRYRPASRQVARRHDRDVAVHEHDGRGVAAREPPSIRRIADEHVRLVRSRPRDQLLHRQVERARREDEEHRNRERPVVGAPGDRPGGEQQRVLYDAEREQVRRRLVEAAAGHELQLVRDGAVERQQAARDGGVQRERRRSGGGEKKDQRRDLAGITHGGRDERRRGSVASPQHSDRL